MQACSLLSPATAKSQVQVRVIGQYWKIKSIKSNLFAQIYNINIGSRKSVHEQGQQDWKQH